jgi:peptidoglycan-associated lipoprotein
MNTNLRAFLTMMPLLAVSSAVAAQRAPVVDPINNPAVRFPNAVQQVPGQPPQPVLSLPAMQADFSAKSGSDTVRFGRDGYLLDERARQTLLRQAEWLRANPMMRVSIEGHADVRQTREHALALGERRAAVVRSFLLSLGIPPSQMTTVSWGRERPASATVHDAAFLQNGRVVTLLRPPEPMPLQLPPQLPPEPVN